MAHPVPTKPFLQPSTEAAMLFAPFGCTHPPPPVPPFLLAQNLSPKDIAGVTSRAHNLPTSIEVISGKGLIVKGHVVQPTTRSMLGV